MKARMWLAPLVAALLILSLGTGVRAAEGDAEPGAVAKPAATGLTGKLVSKSEKRNFRGREMTITVLTLELTNGGDATVVLPWPLEVKLSAKDAEGKEVPTREQRPEDAAAAPKADEGVTVAVLKKGQKLEANLRDGLRSLNFPARGKYKITAEVTVKPAEGELLPGVKLWSGEVKTEEIEHDVQFVFGQRGNRGNRGNRGGGQQGGGQQGGGQQGGGAQPPAGDANKPDVEAF